MPTAEVLAQIEAMNVVELGTPARVQGIATGRVAIIGEFADVTYATTVSAAGIVSSLYRPTLITSPAEINAKLGPFDPTIGDHGASGGNGFVTLRNKLWSGGFVAVPINIAGTKGTRFWRELPTNASATSPRPIVPVAGGTVEAAREFATTGGVRVRCAKTVSFTGNAAQASGTDAAISVQGPDVTFEVEVGGDLTATATVGKALVVGVLGSTAANQGTYRILSSTYSTGTTTMVVECQDGTSITTVLASAQPWRIHAATDADTGGAFALASQGGYLIPARPLTNNSGSTSGSGTITEATLLTPVLAVAAGAARTWEPLSGLRMKIMPTESSVAGGLAFDPNIHAINAVSHATIDTQYVAAMESLLGESTPQKTVTIGPVCSRTSHTIRLQQRANALTAARYGYGRVLPMSPPVNTLSRDTVTGTNPGVDSYRDEQVMYLWFGLQTYIPEAVGHSIKGADGLLYTDGYVDTPSDAWMASVLSTLPPEEDPAQETSAVKEVLVAATGYQRGAPVLNIDDYIVLKSEGIVCPNYNEELACCVFQSGVTTSLVSGETDINRRRFSYYIDDTVTGFMRRYVKRLDKPATKEAALDAINGFFSGLLSEENPQDSRIRGFSISISMNTAETEGQGFWYVGWNVQSYSSLKAIVGVSRIGPTVNTRTA